MKKKTINSNCPEFGYELLSAVPYAYSLYKKGLLAKTISAIDTKCLYYFSPVHVEIDKKRSWDNVLELQKNKFPNSEIHRKQLDWEYFSPPPFQEYYQKNSIHFDKETLVIFNRYNYEWKQPPINFLNLETLRELFVLLQDKYQVVYINIFGHSQYYDHADALDLKDFVLLQEFPKILTINSLLQSYTNLTYNEIQMRLFSKCTKYISSNGGQLILSAYFGGENIIFSKKCRELHPKVNSFNNWYHRLGGGTFFHVNTYNDLLSIVKNKWAL